MYVCKCVHLFWPLWRGEGENELKEGGGEGTEGTEGTEGARTSYNCPAESQRNSWGKECILLEQKNVSKQKIKRLIMC